MGRCYLFKLMRYQGELLLALEGKLKDKSERLIAIDLFGEESIEGNWHDGAPERGVVRRRVDESLRLMNGGYRELVTGHGRPRRCGFSPM